MLTGLRRHLTYANVVSTTCLFIVLGGSAYAATMLEDNSVFSRHITDGQVFTRDVQNGNLRSEDFAPGVLSTAKGYARVSASGLLNPDRSKGVNGVTQSDNTPPGAGNEYCFDLSFFPKVAVGSPFANNNATVATAVRGDQAAALSNCSAPYRDAVVVTRAAETGAGAEVTFDVFFE